MKFIQFRIQNFKGIVDTTIALGSSTPSVHTLVGLNESGKTTVLEAINLFQPDVDGMHALAQQETPKGGKEQLIPKSKRADFTAEIRIEAKVALDEADIDALCEHVRVRTH